MDRLDTLLTTVRRRIFGLEDYAKTRLLTRSGRKADRISSMRRMG